MVWGTLRGDSAVEGRGEVIERMSERSRKRIELWGADLGKSLVGDFVTQAFVAYLVYWPQRNALGLYTLVWGRMCGCGDRLPGETRSEGAGEALRGGICLLRPKDRDGVGSDDGGAGDGRADDDRGQPGKGGEADPGGTPDSGSGSWRFESSLPSQKTP